MLRPPRKSVDWYDDFFPAFRPLFDAIHPQTTKAEVRAALKYLGLKRGQTFLDCPCGIGRITLPLASHGIRVTGVDFMQSYLDELEAKAARKRLPIETLRADMRRISFDREFDAAGNLWTSFGFFKNESDNQRVINRMYRALKPGGKFMLHVINRDWLIRHYSAEGWTTAGKTRLFERRYFDMATSTNYGRCIIVDGNKKYYRESRLRLYAYHELIAMFLRAGFVDIVGYGGYHGEAITYESRMMWVVGTRPLD